jgi:RepB DNA-primase N-terminal domain
MNEDPHHVGHDAAGAEAVDQEQQSTRPSLNGQSRERTNGTCLADVRAHVEILHRHAEPFRGRGKLIVASYGQDPITGKNISPKVLHFGIGHIDPMVEQIDVLSHEQHRNIYIPLAILHPDLPPGKKGEESQVVASLGLVADFDDTDAANFRERMPVRANYVIETSPGRFQPFLLFDEPTEPGHAKHLAQSLKDFTVCDHGTADISHVWRIPGTLNWPNKKKVDQGRSPTPQLVNVAQCWDGSLTAFRTLKAALTASEEDTGNNKKNNGGRVYLRRDPDFRHQWVYEGVRSRGAGCTQNLGKPTPCRGAWNVH